MMNNTLSQKCTHNEHYPEDLDLECTNQDSDGQEAEELDMGNSDQHSDQ